MKNVFDDLCDVLEIYSTINSAVNSQLVYAIEKTVEQVVTGNPVGNFYTNKQGDIRIELAANGFTKDELEITISNFIVSVKGVHNEETVKAESEAGWLAYGHNRLSKRQFKKTFVLPSTIDTDNYSATLKDGILTLVFKVNPKNVKKINIE